ncbi:MAG: hypothetical protein AAGD07_22130, partial [Planctomycetota bacterium]
MNNPFAPPPDSQSTVPETDAGSPRSVLGIFCSSVLALVYATVLAMSIYEYANAPKNLSKVGYMRHGVASAAFVLIC